MNQNIKTYKCLGVEFIGQCDEELIAVCPFCNKNKLYIHHEEGLFDCKVCGKKGNKYTFLKYYHQQLIDNTDLKKYNTLSRDRDRIPVEAFQAAKLAYVGTTKHWIIPVYNQENRLVNLRVWNRDTNILKHIGGCSASIYNLNRIHDSDHIYLCEGEWDAIVLQWVLDTHKIDAVAMAVPGAGTFKEEWCRHFFDKSIAIVYDNDEAGKEGALRTIKLLTKNIAFKSLSVIKWNSDFSDKYDIKDLVRDNLKQSEVCIPIINDLLEDTEKQEEEDEEVVIRTSFNELLEDYKEHICVTEEIRKGLILQFSVVFSNALPDCPLWLFIVGPAGSGKSMILQSISDNPETHFESSLGAKTLVSGWKSDEGNDPSLLPRIIGKTLIIKEYTEIMALPSKEQEQVFSSLRGAYDGRVDRIYANEVTRVYPAPGSGHKTCHFSILAGVTNTIHAHGKAELGERFLKYQMFPDNHDPIDQIKAAMDNTLKQEFPEIELRKVTKAFIKHMTSKDFIAPIVPKSVLNKIIGLSQLVAIIRANVERSKGELAYRASPEVGTRLAKQFLKLAQCIAFTLGKSRVDKECFSLVQRVGMDTCYGWHRDVIMTMLKHPEGMLKKDISREAIIAPATVEKCLNDLYELKALENTPLDNGEKGRPAYLWKVSNYVKELFELAQLNEINEEKTKGKKKIFKKRKTVIPTVPTT